MCVRLRGIEWYLKRLCLMIHIQWIHRLLSFVVFFAFCLAPELFILTLETFGFWENLVLGNFCPRFSFVCWISTCDYSVYRCYLNAIRHLYVASVHRWAPSIISISAKYWCRSSEKMEIFIVSMARLLRERLVATFSYTYWSFWDCTSCPWWSSNS